jgi:hypothetical protein
MKSDEGRKETFSLTECAFQSISCRQPSAQLMYHDRDLGTRQAKAFQIAGDLLVAFSAHPETTTARDVARLRSYMKQLALNDGVVANFGKRALTLRAVLMDRTQSGSHEERAAN